MSPIIKSINKINKYNNAFLFIILYLFITDIKFFFFPLSTRKIIGLIGIGYISINYFRLKSSIICCGLLMYICLIMECIISSAFTGFQDFSFEVLLLSRITILYGIYFIYKCWGNLNLIQFLRYFIIIVLINDVISLFAFIFPSVAYTITTLEPIGDYVAEKYEGLRCVGPGIFRYFEGGVVNCLAIISTIYLYSIKKNSLGKTIFLLGILIVLGLLIARTTIIGLFGFIFVCSNWEKTKGKILKLACIIIITLPTIFILLDFLFQDNPAIKFAFEMIYNYVEGKGFETESSNSLSYQYIFPKEIKSWLIGDGIWLYNNEYYMKTDVGYSRLMFLWGIIGNLTFILFLLRIIKIATKNVLKINKDFAYIILFTLVLLNAKGFTDINYFFIPVMLLIHAKRPSLYENF